MAQGVHGTLALQVPRNSPHLFSGEPGEGSGAQGTQGLSKVGERSQCFLDRQKDGFSVRTREPPRFHPNLGLSPSDRRAQQPLWATSEGGQSCRAPSPGEQASPRSACRCTNGPMVSPLGRVQGLLQLPMAATRWHRRVQHRQLWPSVRLAGQEDMGPWSQPQLCLGRP